MQQLKYPKLAAETIKAESSVWFLRIQLLPILALFVTGCGPEAEQIQATSRPFEGVTLTLHCTDRSLADALNGIARAWTTRTGATVQVISTADSPADVLIIPPEAVGALAERGELQPVPATLRDTGNAYHWNGILSVYRGEQFAGWGAQIVALPIAGEGHVLVYRKDRYSDPVASYHYTLETDRELAAPATWEEYACQADFFQRLDNRPALPPLSPQPHALANAFFRVAASYDRVAIGEAESTPHTVDALAFAFQTTNGQSRLDRPAFRQAARWFASLKNVTATTIEEPAHALANGHAVLGVLSLAELSHLKQGTQWSPSRFGIAPLPGTSSYFDAAGKALPAEGNYIPYFSGGRLGAVHRRCTHANAAFDLLAEISGPTRSLELISRTELGIGPFRDAHLDRDRLVIWLGYGFDEESSEQLQEALRANLSRSVRNPVFGLRGPDQAKLNAVLNREVAAIVQGTSTPEAGLKRVLTQWNTIDAAVPADQLRLWRRKAVGLN